MRVLRIEVGREAGTAFTIDVDKRQYLITAKHVIADVPAEVDETTIRVTKARQRVDVHVKILRCADPIDIAVLVPDQPLTVSFPLEPTVASLKFGQDTYFLGFPYGQEGEVYPDPDGYPIPFIRKGIFMSDDALRIYLDGYNNFGFSGAPIVFRDMDKMSEWVFKVAGVVSGFHPENTPTLVERPLAPGDDVKKLDPSRIVTHDGGTFVLVEEKPPRWVQLNSGIVIGFNIKNAVDLIKEHPIGPVTGQ